MSPDEAFRFVVKTVVQHKEGMELTDEQRRVIDYLGPEYLDNVKRDWTGKWVVLR